MNLLFAKIEILFSNCRYILYGFIIFNPVILTKSFSLLAIKIKYCSIRFAFD